MVKVCECCGHPIPDLNVQLALTRGQRRLFEVIQNAGVSGIHPRTIIDKLYAGDPNGGPVTALNCIHVQRTKMRPHLASFGLRITTTTGHGSVWRLEKL